MTAASVHIIFSLQVSRRCEARVRRKLMVGLASRRPTTDNDYKLSFAAAFVLAFVNSTTKLSKN